MSKFPLLILTNFIGLILALHQRGSLLDETQRIDSLIEDLFIKDSTNDYNNNHLVNKPRTNKAQVTSRGKIEHCDPDNCVPNHLCANNTIITNGEGFIDLRFDAPDLNENKYRCHYLETCCAISDRLSAPRSVQTQRRNGCGNRYSNGVGFRVIGNKGEAQFGEFPWMMAILREESSNGDIMNVYICGGSLIHPRVVLTVAHCVNNIIANRLKVRAGEWDTQTTNEMWPHQDRKAERVIIHENYYEGALYNDIALLVLEKSFEINENVQTICLPQQNSNFDHELCAASGWGKNLFGQEGKYQVILKKIELPVVPRSNCQGSLRKTRLGKHFNLHSSFICAGGEKGKDTCKGDGGSPLVCRIPDTEHQYYQAGIVAWGVGCGDDKIPGVYVNVPLFRLWIDRQFLLLNFNSSFYSA